MTTYVVKLAYGIHSEQHVKSAIARTKIRQRSRILIAISPYYSQVQLLAVEEKRHLPRAINARCRGPKNSRVESPMELFEHVTAQYVS
jgi:hypothetical protein